jgi:MOSC domain-containing protein YiiM
VKTKVDAICVGQPQPFNGAELSAFVKAPVKGAASIRTHGIIGDIQADSKNHGGPDMAVHLYSSDHYGWWAEQLDDHELLDHAPAFGENLVASGITEEGVHIGDRFKLGSALLEVSQPRQPCWKIEHRFGRKGMVKKIIKRHNCGWYFRVIEEGEAEAGDFLDRTETGHSDWPIARLFAKLYDPAHKARLDELREIAELEKLCTLWRTRVAEAVEGFTQ